MCTAITLCTKHRLFGRTLDAERKYGEELIITPRFFPLEFTDQSELKSHLAYIGMGVMSEGEPLYFDGLNEAGVCIAALNFPRFAKYLPYSPRAKNIASFELIPRILARCASIGDVREELSCACITDTPFSNALPPTPLHWIISARDGCVTVEQTEAGLKIYDNKPGVLTNAPEFLFHITRLAEFSGLTAENPKCAAAENNQFISGGYGALGLPGDFSSPSRFIRADFLKKNTVVGEDGVGAFFHIMDSLSLPLGAVVDNGGFAHRTAYTSCMDADGGMYYFHTYENRRICAVKLDRRLALLNRPTNISVSQAQDVDYISLI